MLFFKDSLELHSLKTGNLEVVPYFCTEDSEGFCFLLFALGADKGVLNRSTGNSLCSADRPFALICIPQLVEENLGRSKSAIFPP